MKHKKVEIGSVSSGTLREEDLISAFYNELEYYRPGTAKKIRKDYKKIFDFLDSQDYPDFNDYPYTEEYSENDLNDDYHYCIEELINELDALSPPYFYFGTNEADLADFGWWFLDLYEILDWNRDNTISVSDLNDIPKDFVGDVFEVNDHGNVSLYHRGKNHHLYSIWSIV